MFFRRKYELDMMTFRAPPMLSDDSHGQAGALDVM
jgi:hypothetical protein